MRHRSCDHSCLLRVGCWRGSLRRRLQAQLSCTGQLADLGIAFRPAPIEVGSGRIRRTWPGGRGMLSAWVLIETELGKVAQVAQALIDLDGM
jgi:hypothetical protein